MGDRACVKLLYYENPTNATFSNFPAFVLFFLNTTIFYFKMPLNVEADYENIIPSLLRPQKQFITAKI